MISKNLNQCYYVFYQLSCSWWFFFQLNQSLLWTGCPFFGNASASACVSDPQEGQDRSNAELREPFHSLWNAQGTPLGPQWVQLFFESAQMLSKVGLQKVRNTTKGISMLLWRYADRSWKNITARLSCIAHTWTHSTVWCPSSALYTSSKLLQNSNNNTSCNWNCTTITTRTITRKWKLQASKRYEIEYDQLFILILFWAFKPSIPANQPASSLTRKYVRQPRFNPQILHLSCCMAEKQSAWGYVQIPPQSHPRRTELGF